jgi:hypothetical protein
MKLRQMQTVMTLTAMIGLALDHALAADTDIYYVYDGHKASQVMERDLAGMDIDEWQIWLYERGADTGGPNHWGLIEGKTSDAVTKQLKADQKFELAYAKFMGQPPDSDPLTYFNPLGPIAVLKQAPKRAEVIDEIAEKVDGLKEAFCDIQDILNKEPKDKNPYDGLEIN